MLVGHRYADGDGCEYDVSECSLEGATVFGWCRDVHDETDCYEGVPEDRVAHGHCECARNEKYEGHVVDPCPRFYPSD